jgi:hypothetical protein
MENVDEVLEDQRPTDLVICHFYRNGKAIPMAEKLSTNGQ